MRKTQKESVRVRATPVKRRKTPRGFKARAFHGVETEIMSRAEASGLLKNKGSRITGRISKELVDQAKRRTGIMKDTQLIEFALANLALEDNFAETFQSVKGAIDPSIKLGF